MEDYKLRDPIGDEAYQILMSTCPLNRESQPITFYIKVSKVTQTGLTTFDYETARFFARRIYRDAMEEISKEKREKGIVGQERIKPKTRGPLEKAIMKNRPSVQHSNFVEVHRLPLQIGDKKASLPIYVNYDTLSGTEEEKQEIMQIAKNEFDPATTKVLLDQLNEEGLIEDLL